MKARIYVNRHVMAANKKATKETGEIVDNKAIAVNTYKGSIYCKEVEFTAGGKLIQDAEQARCSGATVWIEVDEFESLIIDGKEANRFMFEDLQELDLEDYFWQFVEDFKANKNDNAAHTRSTLAGGQNTSCSLAIARRLSPKYAADKEALQTMFRELRGRLQQKLDRDELKLSIDDFDDLTVSLVGLGKKKYYSVLKNPRSAMYLTDSIKSCYSVLNLLRV